MAVAAYPIVERTASRRKREDDDDDDDDLRYVSFTRRHYTRIQLKGLYYSEEDRKRALVKNDSIEVDPNAMET